VKEVIVPNTRRGCDADIAFLVLNRDIVGITPLKVRMNTPVTTSDVVTSIGYGINNTGAAQGTRLRRDNVSVLATGPNTSNFGVPVAKREFEASQSFCQGDSGGPAISKATGAVIGVVSRTFGCANNYGQIYTMTSGFPVTFGRAMTASGYNIAEESSGDGGTDAGPMDAGADASPKPGSDAGPADAGADADASTEPKPEMDAGPLDAGDGGVAPEDDGGLDEAETPERDGPPNGPRPKPSRVPSEKDGQEFSDGRIPIFVSQGCSAGGPMGGQGAASLASMLSLVFLTRRRRRNRG
jgi:uncharacterized protein (TIGR03382 family)